MSAPAVLTGQTLIGAMNIGLGYVLFRWFEIESKRRSTLKAL